MLLQLHVESDGTYKHILEGQDVGDCGLMWWRKPENLGKPPTFSRGLLPWHMPILGSNGGHSGGKGVLVHVLPKTVFSLIGNCIPKV